MKYLAAFTYAILGFICILYPEIIENMNGIISVLCFGLASMYIKED